MCAVALRSRSPGASGARKAGFPAFIKPCDPSLRAHAPKGQNWFFEIKADGYRAQLHCHGGKVTVFSRTGLDWTAQFSTIAAAASFFKKRDAVIDGEAVVYGNTGIPDFQQLRRRFALIQATDPRHFRDKGFDDPVNLLVHAGPYFQRADTRRLAALRFIPMRSAIVESFLSACGPSPNSVAQLVAKAPGSRPALMAIGRFIGSRTCLLSYCDVSLPSRPCAS
jgi:hypothetical protein